MKIVTILGARPQFVKAATVSRELTKAGLKEVIVHTGQHFDHAMSQVFFDEMEIPNPHYNLEVSGLQHGAMTGRMLEKVEEVLLKEKPDYVMVYGDTNSTLAGALAATKLHIPVAHVEAGLRSFDMKMPEEINRILTDRISQILFCPTQTAVNNLQKEGFQHFNCLIKQVGDVMLDAVLHYKEKSKAISKILDTHQLVGKKFALATLHRAENTNDPTRLRSICESLNEIHHKMKVVLPLHPRTKNYLQTHQIPLQVDVIEPVGYFDILMLLHHCELVLTDSGGLQKEAYFFGKYCITLRDQTEWIELVEEEANSIAGADKNTILRDVGLAKHKQVTFNPALYGTGDAAQKIVATLKQA
ncbi:MAG: non-hydrolyzing UDP-N-acetylglucosamine 2-epimerase [Flammeovirgaceae bacterium]